MGNDFANVSRCLQMRNISDLFENVENIMPETIRDISEDKKLNEIRSYIFYEDCFSKLEGRCNLSYRLSFFRRCKLCKYCSIYSMI